MKLRLALTAGLATLAASTAIAGAVAFTGSATIHYSGAIDHTYHARCEYIAPHKGGPDEDGVELFFGFVSKDSADDLAINQMRPHPAVGRVNLATTKTYRVAFYDTHGRTWGAGWQPGEDLGSGIAVIGAAMKTGHLTATLHGVTDSPGPLHATVTWDCR